MPFSSPYRLFSGLSLLILLSIPTFVPALHELLHYHQHLNCVETAGDVHLHADIYECQLCDYLATFTFLSDAKTIEVVQEENHTESSIAWIDPFISSHTGSYHLRGPPGF